MGAYGEQLPGPSEGIQGAELLQRFREQALKFGTEIRKGDVLTADLIGDIKTVTTHDANVTARTAIIATGIQQKRTEITGEDRFLGAGVSYCVICDGPLFRGRTAAVVGEGPEAVDDATTLSHIASKTYLVSPTGRFQASEKQLREVEEHRVEILKGSRVKAIEGITSVEALRLTDQKGNEQILKVHGVFIASTKTPLTRILSKSGLQTDDKGCIKVDGRMRTNIEGGLRGRGLHMRWTPSVDKRGRRRESSTRRSRTHKNRRKGRLEFSASDLKFVEHLSDVCERLSISVANELLSRRILQVARDSLGDPFLIRRH